MIRQHAAPQSVHRSRFDFLAAEAERAIKSQDMARAVRFAEMAISEQFRHPTFLNLVAYREICAGRTAQALEHLLEAERIAPSDYNILSAMGTCYATLGDLPNALNAFDKAITLCPTFAAAFYNRGIVYETLGRSMRARSDFENAVRFQPDYPEALAKLAYDASNRGAYDTARSYAQRALELSPSDIVSVMSLAMADIAEGNFSGAERLVTLHLNNAQLTTHNRAMLIGILGDSLDGQGDRKSAFRAYCHSNELMRESYADSVPHQAEPPTHQVERLISFFNNTAASCWTDGQSAPNNSSDSRAVSFLVGFPRSGTTLLEQALAGHPDVETSEEQDLLRPAIADFIESADGLERLQRLPEQQAQEYRERYWSLLSKSGCTATHFIDKLPLNLIYLPIIAKIFPTAKVIFARRDPRDVVFSCFRRRFAMTPQMYELLTLEGVAHYYDATMQLAVLYHKRLGLPWKEMIYEEVVTDFEGQMRSLCQFIGLDWNCAIGGFATRLARRPVDTPSSAQLVKGLTRDSIGAWRGYQDQLQPILPLLSFWIKRFGYS